MTMFGSNTVGEANTPERQQAARVRANAEQKYTAIRSRDDLSDLGKQAQIAAVHVRTQAKLADLAQSERDRRATERQDAETTLYGLPRTPLTGADAISARDATDRAAQLAAPSTAATLLDQAMRNHDQQLANAIAMQANGNGWRDVLSEYIADDPAKQAAYDTLKQHDATVDTPQDRMTASMIFRGGTPPEVKGLSTAKLADLADQASRIE